MIFKAFRRRDSILPMQLDRVNRHSGVKTILELSQKVSGIHLYFTFLIAENSHLMIIFIFQSRTNQIKINYLKGPSRIRLKDKSIKSERLSVESDKKWVNNTITKDDTHFFGFPPVSRIAVMPPTNNHVHRIIMRRERLKKSYFVFLLLMHSCEMSLICTGSFNFFLRIAQ